jgi:hypothetical protein
MRIIPLGAAAISVAGLAACAPINGFGTGQSAVGNVGAQFSYTQTGAARGTMAARLTNGQVYQGVFFQIRSESVVDYDPLWNGWGPGSRWGRGWGGRGWGDGWGGWGPWGPSMETVTHYSGQVLANLQGPGGFMRCNFALMRPRSGIAGGGVGQCQLPTGAIIHAQFPPARGY